MEVKIKIGISARHVHLNEETYQKLFDEPLTVRNKLNQIGQFAANETVSLKTEKGQMNNVRIIGPLRKYNQVEISKSDARIFGLNPPVRRSGDLEDSEEIEIIGPKGSVKVKAAIIANRHVHFSLEDAEKYHVQDGQKLSLVIDGIKKGVIEVEAKVSSDGFMEVHLDTDDANAFLLNQGDTQKLIIN